MLSETFFDSYRGVVDRIKEREAHMREIRDAYIKYQREMALDIVAESGVIKDVILQLLEELQQNFQENAAVFVMIQDMHKYVDAYTMSPRVIQRAVNSDTRTDQDFYEEETLHREDYNRYSDPSSDDDQFVTPKNSVEELPDDEDENQPGQHDSRQGRDRSADSGSDDESTQLYF